MTDRVKGFYVALEHDMRIDDLELLMSAVKQLKGVAGVEAQLADVGDWMARQETRNGVAKKLLDLSREIQNVPRVV